MRLLGTAGRGWLLRRILDWGGWLGTFLLAAIQLYNTLPPHAQASLQSALSGNWREITLGALVPLLGLVVSQVQSWRATVEPQVVTPEGEKVKLPPDETAAITPSAPLPPRRPTLLDRLMNR